MGKTFSTGLLTNGIWQDSSNNIGIGAAPSGTYKFEVTGTAKISGVATFGSTLSNGTYSYTLPSDTGTLALTSALSSYVPYSGATGAVNLGAYNLTVNGISVGKGAGTGALNTAIGYLSLSQNTTGYNNLALGAYSLSTNSGGIYNAALGYQALISNTSGSSNVSVGSLSMHDNTTGQNNTAIGTSSGYYITTGSYNTIVGNYAGATTLDSNVILADGNGNLRFVGFSTGNVYLGAGTTLPTDSGYKLDVNGTGRFSGANLTIGSAVAATNVKLFLNGVASKAAGIEFQQSGTTQWYIGNGIASEDNNFELYNSNGTMAMKIIKSTNAINFTGAATFSSTSGQPLTVSSTINCEVVLKRANTTNGAGLGFYTNATHNWLLGTAWGETSSNFILYNAATGTQSFKVDYGTNAATFSSSVTAVTQFNAFNDRNYLARGGFRLTSPTNNASTLDISVGDNTTYINGNYFSGGNDNTIIIGTYANYANQLVLKPTGNVLIGTTSDNGQGKLRVNGNVTIGNDSTFNPAYIVLNTAQNSYSFGVNGLCSQWEFTNGAPTIVATINGATGVYTALSDINKKKDFEASTIGLKEVLQLKPTLYRFKDGKENAEKDLGFIAQEVKEFIPQAYVESGEGEDIFIGLQDRPIIAALVKAIQEMNTKIIQLEKLVATINK